MKNLTSGGNNFNDFPENQLSTFHRIGRWRCHILYFTSVYLPYHLRRLWPYTGVA